MNNLVSIIVPVYNEEADILRTLTALVNQRYSNKEIIVVDDASQDRTAEIAEECARKYKCIRLIRQPVNRGAGSARNAGIRNSRGEILVILNADVFPGEDFLERILPHYLKENADYVLVGAEIANQRYLFPRYMEASSRFSYEGKDWVEWTEGFSCRREAAYGIGLFPEDIPGCGGEDAIFGMRLSRDYKKVIDRSIIVPHVAPHTLKGFWRQQQARGRATPYVYRYIYKKPLLLITICFLGKLFYWPARNLVKFPLFFFYYCYHSQQEINHRWRDLFPFIYAIAVQMFAIRIGEWKGWLEIFYKKA